MTYEKTEIVPIEPEFAELTNYNRARQTLTDAKTVDEVKAYETTHESFRPIAN
jgi:hypothetical protein